MYKYLSLQYFTFTSLSPSADLYRRSHVFVVIIKARGSQLQYNYCICFSHLLPFRSELYSWLLFGNALIIASCDEVEADEG